MSATRQCIRCSGTITKCDGFALARDWGKHIPMREHCARCVEWLETLSPEQRREYLLLLGD
jgi:hypothetical protein